MALPGYETPILTSTFNQTEVKQYSMLGIDFIAYTPNSLTTPVTIYVNGLPVTELTVDRTVQTYTYRVDKVED